MKIIKNKKTVVLKLDDGNAVPVDSLPESLQESVEFLDELRVRYSTALFEAETLKLAITAAFSKIISDYNIHQQTLRSAGEQPPK